MVSTGAALALAGAGLGRVAPAAGQEGADPTPAVAATGSLAAMLALAPDLPALPDQESQQLAQFADTAAQLAAVGVEPPTGDDRAARSSWARATSWLPLPTPLADHALDGEWRAVFGFDAPRSIARWWSAHRPCSWRSCRGGSSKRSCARPGRQTGTGR